MSNSVINIHVISYVSEWYVSVEFRLLQGQIGVDERKVIFRLFVCFDLDVTTFFTFLVCLGRVCAFLWSNQRRWARYFLERVTCLALSITLFTFLEPLGRIYAFALPGRMESFDLIVDTFFTFLKRLGKFYPFVWSHRSRWVKRLFLDRFSCFKLGVTIFLTILVRLGQMYVFAWSNQHRWSKSHSSAKLPALI